MIALRGAVHVACFHHSCLHNGVWRCLTEDVSVRRHATSFSMVHVASPRTAALSVQNEMRIANAGKSNNKKRDLFDVGGTLGW